MNTQLKRGGEVIVTLLEESEKDYETTLKKSVDIVLNDTYLLLDIINKVIKIAPQPIKSAFDELSMVCSDEENFDNVYIKNCQRISVNKKSSQFINKFAKKYSISLHDDELDKEKFNNVLQLFTLNSKFLNKPFFFICDYPFWNLHYLYTWLKEHSTSAIVELSKSEKRILIGLVKVETKDFIIKSSKSIILEVQYDTLLDNICKKYKVNNIAEAMALYIYQNDLSDVL